MLSKKKGMTRQWQTQKKRQSKKVLRSREITNLFTASAQSMISGFQSYKIFEGANTNERGSITVVAYGVQS